MIIDNGHWVCAERMSLELMRMSSLKKSASFRSRIPVRRTNPLPRRCYSPPPLLNAEQTIRTTASASAISNYLQEQQEEQPNRGRNLVLSKNRKNNCNNNSNQQNRRSRQHACLMTYASSAAKKIPTYSSSSYSSGDESEDSDEPIQEKVSQTKTVLHHQTIAFRLIFFSSISAVFHKKISILIVVSDIDEKQFDTQSNKCIGRCNELRRITGFN